MATREELLIAQTTLGYLNNIQRDLRKCAASYLAAIAATPRTLSTAQLGDYVHRDAAGMGAVLDRMNVFFSDATKKQKLVSGLAFYGITWATIASDWQVGRNACTAQANADVSTDAAITSAANATLAAVPALDVME
jgi:hypothetical protein